MAGSAFKDAEVLAALEGYVAVYVDADVDGEAVRSYGVRALPTTAFLDARGEEIDRVVGAVAPAAFAARLRKLQDRL